MVVQQIVQLALNLRHHLLATHEGGSEHLVRSRRRGRFGTCAPRRARCRRSGARWSIAPSRRAPHRGVLLRATCRRVRAAPPRRRVAPAATSPSLGQESLVPAPDTLPARWDAALWCEATATPASMRPAQRAPSLAQSNGAWLPLCQVHGKASVVAGGTNVGNCDNTESS